MVSLSNHEGARLRWLCLSPAAGGSPPLSRLFQERHRLDMRRPQELVDGRYAPHVIAALDVDRQVAGERLWVARNGGDERNRRAGNLSRLVFGAGARRVEDEPLEAGKLPCRQGAAVEVAPLRRHPPEARASPE